MRFWGLGLQQMNLGGNSLSHNKVIASLYFDKVNTQLHIWLQIMSAFPSSLCVPGNVSLLQQEIRSPYYLCFLDTCHEFSIIAKVLINSLYFGLPTHCLPAPPTRDYINLRSLMFLEQKWNGGSWTFEYIML